MSPHSADVEDPRRDVDGQGELGVAIAFLFFLFYFSIALTVGFSGPAASRHAYGEVPQGGPIAQPIAFFTNLSFIVAGLIALREVERATVFGVGLALLVLWMGPASMLEHGTLTTTWGWADATAIHWFALWILGYLICGDRLGWFLALQAITWLVVGVYTWHVERARQLATMGLLGLAVVAMAITLLARGHRTARLWRGFFVVLLWFGAAAIFLVGGARDHWAAPWGHGAWHVLCAIAMLGAARLLRDLTAASPPSPSDRSVPSSSPP